MNGCMTHRSLALLFLVACGSSTPSSTSSTSVPPPAAAPIQSAAPVVTQSPTPIASAPAPKPMKQAEKLALKRLVLAHGIDKREPQDVSTTFNAKESKIYAFV